MRRLLFVSIIVLHCPLIAAELTMNDPMIRVVASVQQMRDHCGIAGTYDACTQFVGFRLEASCTFESASWRIRTQAAVTPLMILYNLASLRHENEHISDMRSSLTSYLGWLESQRFDSGDACRATSAAAMTGFESTVREFARASLELRDPTTRSR